MTPDINVWGMIPAWLSYLDNRMPTNYSSAEFLDLLGDHVGTSCAALIGGGGKTSLLLRLGQELVDRSSGKNVLLAALTRLQHNLEDGSITCQRMLEVGADEMMQRHNPMFVLGLPISSESENETSDLTITGLRHRFAATVFECDGARGLPLKAHNQRDPVVPEFASNAIVIVGADVVGTRVSDGLVHRPELFCDTWEVGSDHELDVSFITTVITSKRGYRRKIPDSVPTSYYVNKADQFPRQANELARTIARQSGQPTWMGSLHEGWLERVR